MSILPTWNDLRGKVWYDVILGSGKAAIATGLFGGFMGYFGNAVWWEKILVGLAVFLVSYILWILFCVYGRGKPPSPPLPPPEGGVGGDGGIGTIRGGSGTIIGGRGGRGGHFGRGGSGGGGTIEGGSGTIIGGDGGDAGYFDEEGNPHGGAGGKSGLHRMRELGLLDPTWETALLLVELRNEYIATHKDAPAGITHGHDSLPADWVNAKFRERKIPLHYELTSNGNKITPLEKE